MAAEKKCLRCGGTNLEPGHIQGICGLHFQPKNVKSCTLRTADVLIEANLCPDCGTLELVGDIRKARSLTANPDGKARSGVQRDVQCP
ncbi:MAG: hypothetical protein JW993_09570 [Sedimentisphaerales bacterium]|nr:hypothetical protein [Sedimentisphaerales bacterium]